MTPGIGTFWVGGGSEDVATVMDICLGETMDEDEIE